MRRISLAVFVVALASAVTTHAANAESVTVGIGTLSLLPVEGPLVSVLAPVVPDGHGLTIVGEGNVLRAAPVEGNRIAVSIRGDGNGVGAFESLLPAPLLPSVLIPGTLRQEGTGNDIALGIEGNANLFAVSQFGANNLVRGSVTGTANQVAVVQRGTRNALEFSQVGNGNVLGVRQDSW